MPFVPVLLAFLVLICGAGVVLVLRELRSARTERLQQELLAIFAPAVPAALENPRQLLLWYPTAETARRLFPNAFVALDAAARGRFPFTRDHLASAHARWTAAWLAWEQSHDADCKLKAAMLEQELARASGQDAGTIRARVAALDREKLERYQQRYEEYITVAKALAALDA